MKGRKRKPNAIRKLQGNPGRRDVPNEPKMRKGIPACPRHLTGEARVEWERIVPELAVADLLKHCDRAALAAYCACYGRWCQAEELIETHGMTYDANGLLKVNPAVRIAQDAMALMKSYLVEFGLTPASRSKVSAEPQEEADPMDEFLGGGAPATGFGVQKTGEA
jgi:P27 family predicted phage terminase small subunit